MLFDLVLVIKNSSITFWEHKILVFFIFLSHFSSSSLHRISNRIMRKYLLILVATLSLMGAKAQVANVHLSFGSTGVVYPNQVNEGDLISFSFWMVNTGNIPLTSSIDILIAIDTSFTARSLGDFMDVDSVLSPNDSIFIITWDQVSSANYKQGDNIVVIWPGAVSPFPITADEFVGNIHMSSPISVQQKQSDEFNVYPNPILESATIKAQQPISTFKMIDILGNAVRYAENVQDNFIAIHKNELESGIYFIVIKMGETTQIKKVIIK